MIQIEQIRHYFPAQIREDAMFDKYILKEYLQLMILDCLSATPFTRKITLIGGTNLRLAKGIDRFSEDLDFDCKNLSEDEFVEMTNGIITFLERSGFHVETRDKANPNLSAYSRSIYFPELLYGLGLSGHREERFLIKIEVQDQGITYKPVIVNIKGCGYFFPFPVPSDSVLFIRFGIERSSGRTFFNKDRSSGSGDYIQSRHSQYQRLRIFFSFSRTFG